ncbi:MAG: hypothetical protein KBC96_10590 [Armatimonadetes bacterium]|nr:hypothetical protein [Armatimonadota bacterium]
MYTRRAVRALFTALAAALCLASLASADRIVQSDDFDDGDLTAGPRWTYVKPGSAAVSGEQKTSGSYSLKVASNNELGAVHTCSGVRSADQPFTSTFNLYVESMGDEAIPWSVQNADAGIAAIIFILPGGLVQLYVPGSGSGVTVNLARHISYGAWHSFRVTYDGLTTNLYLDGSAVPDASISLTYMREPSYVCVGNFVMAHTSTFYVDDLVFTRPGDVAPAKIYVQVCSDTSTGGINTAAEHIDFPELDTTYTTPEGQAARVMSESYRDAHRDSLGNTIKFTWYMQMGSVYSAGTDTGPLLPFELMEDYHGGSIERWGDEMAYHYHTWFWSDPNGDGLWYWNQAPDFSYCRPDFDRTMAHMLLDRGFYPSSFRSGWHYMDDGWQSYLDELIPYRFENDWPAYRTTTEEPLGNLYDWRRAPSAWVPWHPDPNDYQSPGALRGWESRSKYIAGATTAILTEAFYKALDGEAQLLTLFSHLKEADFPEQVDALHIRLSDLHASLPLVDFEYLTGRECMLKWRNGSDVTPPNIQVETEDAGGMRTATITFDEQIYQLRPFAARSDAQGNYELMACALVGPNRWRVSYDVADTVQAAVGVTDWFGNPAVRFLPTPLRITDAAASNVITTGAEVRWKTNRPADTRVEYENVSSPGAASALFEAERKLAHRVTLAGLLPGQVYRVRLSAQDENGGEAESEELYILTPVLDAFIIDNLDPGFSVEGAWSTGSVTPGAYGPDYRYASASPSGTSRAYWTWTAPADGIYDVQARWSAGANRSTAARYSVIIGGNEYNRTVDQQVNGATWNVLGTNSLSQGDTVTVRLTNAADSGFVVIADSVRFEPAYTPVENIGIARLLSDGESVLVTGAVTGVFGSRFYVEALDRSSAVEVQGLGVSVGDVVEVGGTLSTAAGERMLIGRHIKPTGETAHLRPLGVAGRSLNDCASGILVRIWGRVTSVGSGFFYVDDGSGLTDCAGGIGLRVDSSRLTSPPAPDDLAVATGVLSTETHDCGEVRVLRPRADDDLRAYPGY